MAAQQITTPRGSIVLGGNGHAELTWDSTFAARMNQSLKRTQMYVDNEVLRYCSRLVPFEIGRASCRERVSA